MLYVVYHLPVFWSVHKIVKGDYYLWHVFPSIHMEQLSSHWMDFYKTCCIFWLSRKFKFHENHTRITGTLHEDQYTFLIIPCSVLLRLRNVSEVVEEIRTPNLCSIMSFQKLFHLWDNVDKYCTARQATDNNMAHVHCILDTSVYKYTIRILILHYKNGHTNAPFLFSLLCILFCYLLYLFFKRGFHAPFTCLLCCLCLRFIQ